LRRFDCDVLSDYVGIILYDSCNKFVSVKCNGMERVHIYSGECVHQVGVSLTKKHWSSLAAFSCRMFIEGWDVVSV